MAGYVVRDESQTGAGIIDSRFTAKAQLHWKICKAALVNWIGNPYRVSGIATI